MTNDLSRSARGEHRARRLMVALLALHAFVLLACEDWTALPVAFQPRWACPSPTPRPTTIKEAIPRPTTTPGVDPGAEIVYYQPWEQEYGLPPMTPTPYTKNGPFYLGQRVEVAPLHVLLTAETGARLAAQQIQIVRIQWRNAGTAMPMDYLNRVRIRSVRGANGAQITSDAWGTNAQALNASGLPTFPATIPPGESEVRVPILTPPGEVAIAEIDFLVQRTGGPTPTPNADHRTGDQPFMTVQWSTGTQHNPSCDDAGVVTSYGNGPQPIPNIAAPPGTARVVQIALNQVGKPYIWGAKGPHAFDCSGLTEWSYAQIGIDIPTGTVGQWPGLPAPPSGSMRSGDLLFYDTRPNGLAEITHVGLTSDLDGDGDWDLVHAASPEYGVRIDEDVFTRPYYASMYMGVRTVR